MALQKTMNHPAGYDFDYHVIEMVEINYAEVGQEIRIHLSCYKDSAAYGGGSSPIMGKASTLALGDPAGLTVLNMEAALIANDPDFSGATQV